MANIAWASPFNIRSAIGRFSLFVADELVRRGHRVTLVRMESGDELAMDALETDLMLVSADECDLDSFDVAFVNFGNHAPYHAQAATLLARHDAIGIFHDAEMRDFNWGLDHRHGLAVETIAGLNAGAAGEGSLVDPAAVPLLATLAAMCSGGIVHGPHYVDIVGEYCAGPVRVIPLCYPELQKAAKTVAKSPQPNVLVFGVITPQKQPDRVLRALGQIKDQFPGTILHLAGAIEGHYKEQLIELALELDVPAPVFHGYVSDEELLALFGGAHAICCLRFPVTEGGSASLVTGLRSGRPMIVSDVASYSMVPDELVHKVSYGESVDDLSAALADILAHRTGSQEQARKAKAWANRNYSATHYADAVEELIEASSAARQVAMLARELAPALIAPDGTTMLSAVPDVAEVLDFFMASQPPAVARKHQKKVVSQ